MAPVTCRSKRGGRAMHVPLHNPRLYPGSIALVEQVRTIDKQRLGRYVGSVSGRTMGDVDRAIHTSLGLQ